MPGWHATDPDLSRPAGRDPGLAAPLRALTPPWRFLLIAAADPEQKDLPLVRGEFEDDPSRPGSDSSTATAF